ncbi:hypothetical protein BAUCODRAFT_459491 [Baudoinia panamericana UAMH 10762]|uniref:SMP-30/Gluconolactonase/LRE-like region domain-containing protein n=1 Tax=Baudoinia panamericana (strain UAMH 10762) TaxID=717646 RepID=M2NF56_BAUPA|nr:uncharacterized protein BAUCODRAFT_459491 [Baudoinia panamericana UAMH 10762]EMC97605.1 hypothetical protein BAUCODRAFT_459491 [Baudoinia panamericana UAMH 10762]
MHFTHVVSVLAASLVLSEGATSPFSPNPPSYLGCIGGPMRQWPGCANTAPAQTNLTNVVTTFANVTCSSYTGPFGVAYDTYHPGRAFVVVGSTLHVLDTSGFTPTVLQSITLGNITVVLMAGGIELTIDGRFIMVATGSNWLIIVDAAKALAGCSDAVVGRIPGNLAAGSSAVLLTVSPNNEYVFVSQEDGNTATTAVNGTQVGTVEVFKLNTPLGGTNDTVTGRSIGYIELGLLVVGSVLSGDGQYLYVASERKSETVGQGTITVLSVPKLETQPNTSFVSQVVTGCGPVRLLLSSDGSTFWTSARESNLLQGFDTSKLISDPDNALIASVQVGTQPVDLIFAKNETRILTADSSRSYVNASAGISVVDVEAALAGNMHASLGSIPTGYFPRQLAVSHDGNTVLVSLYCSCQVQTIDVATLP